MSPYRCGNQQLSSGPAYPVVPCVGPDDQSDPRGQSPFNTLSCPWSVSRTRLASPDRVLSGPRRSTGHGVRCSSRYVSLHGAVPYSSPRKGVQIAWIVGSRTLRLLLTPEEANSAQGGLPRSAVFELLRAARTGRHPKFGSLRALAPRAPPLMTDSLLLALVAQNRWLLARPAACATGLTLPADLR